MSWNHQPKSLLGLLEVGSAGVGDISFFSPFIGLRLGSDYTLMGICSWTRNPNHFAGYQCWTIWESENTFPVRNSIWFIILWFLFLLIVETIWSFPRNQHSINFNYTVSLQHGGGYCTNTYFVDAAMKTSLKFLQAAVSMGLVGSPDANLVNAPTLAKAAGYEVLYWLCYHSHHVLYSLNKRTTSHDLIFAAKINAL